MRSLLPVLLVSLGACAHQPTPKPSPPPAAMPAGPDYAAIVAAPDRIAADRALDGGRKPAAFLAFLGAKPGDHVADLGASGGYTTELLARAVGDAGVVYSQNSPSMLAHIGSKAWDERLARPADRNVKRVEREFADPLPPEATGLDLVVMNVLYHDTVWLKVDRDAMNKGVFAALRSGGAYVIVDSSAKDGHGADDAQTLHRIDEAFVKAEVLKAGFRLDATSDILRNPGDPRDWNTSPKAAGEKRGSGDRFILRFVKP